MAMSSTRSIRVESKEQSAQIIKEALSNTAGTARDIVAFNAGLAIYAGNGTDSIESGLKIAFDTIASGAARAKLDEFCTYTRKL